MKGHLRRGGGVQCKIFFFLSQPDLASAARFDRDRPDLIQGWPGCGEKKWGKGRAAKGRGHPAVCSGVPPLDNLSRPYNRMA